jgi:hypothetical protein
MPALRLTDPAVLSFVLIPLLLVAALAWGIAAASRRLGEPDAARRRALVVVVGAAAWMGATWAAAASGVLRRWDTTPPPLAFLVLGLIGVSLLLAFSGYGRRLAIGLPLWALVAVQGFRLPLEIAMHTMYERGIMPEQMSYSGWNFDVLTGASALVVAAVLRSGHGSRRLVAAWNVAGLALLVNISVIAIVSTPRVQYFGPDRLNTWVMYPPFVWLPAVMVAAALAGHLIVFRALRHHRT